MKYLLHTWAVGDTVYDGVHQAIISKEVGVNIYEVVYSDTSLGKAIVLGTVLKKERQGARTELPYFSLDRSCTCGVSSVGGSKHSEYCDLYTKEWK